MSLAHVDEVLGIEREAFSNPWQRSDFEYALGRSSALSVVVRQGGHLVGYAVGFFIRSEFHLANLAVRDARRGEGIGHWLLARVIDGVRARGARVITLEVRVSNGPALALYEGSGFRQVAVQKDYYTHPKEDALVMIKPLLDDPWK